MNSKDLEARITRLEDIEEIRKLEHIYGYYMDNGRNDLVVDLFADEAESIEIADRGVFYGKEGVRRFFTGFMDGHAKQKEKGCMYMHTQHQDVINVAPDGNTAWGRFYCLMIQAHMEIVPGVPTAAWGFGVYENTYVKENGKWKFKKVHFNITFRSPYADGWVKTPMVAEGRAKGADAPPTAYSPYPNQKLVPFHWKHPITGE
jgi:hypothetical protein